MCIRDRDTPFLIAIVLALSLGSIPIVSQPSFLQTDKKSPTPAPISKILPFADSVLINFNSVSYTHLDVYKRQVLDFYERLLPMPI